MKCCNAICTATSEQKSLLVEPIIWPVVTNTITGIKMRTLFALEAVAVTNGIEAKKYRAQRGRFGR